jgi:hypothetical protein
MREINANKETMVIVINNPRFRLDFGVFVDVLLEVLLDMIREGVLMSEYISEALVVELDIDKSC